MNKKKTYQQPAMEVILLTNRMVPLCASGGAEARQRDNVDDWDDVDETRSTIWDE